MALGAALVALATSVSACGSAPAPAAIVRHTTLYKGWTRPLNQWAQTVAAGLPLTKTAQQAVRYNVHLDVLVDNHAVEVPGGLGINLNQNGTPTKYGHPGMAAIATRSPSGIINIDSSSDSPYTLGQVFKEWGVYLSTTQLGGYQNGIQGRQVHTYVNGVQWRGDPNKIVLRSHQEIAVIVAIKNQPVMVPPMYQFPKGM